MQYFIDFLNELKAGTSYPVYLFYGPEKYLIQQAVGRLKQNLLPTGGEQFNYQVLDGEQVTVQDITAAAGEAPFMLGQRLLQVVSPSFIRPAPKKKEAADQERQSQSEKQLKADEKAYLDYLKEPASSTVLVLVADLSVDKRKKVYKETVRVGKVVEFTRLRPSEIRKWLNQQASKEKCRLEPAAMQLLLERCGVDLFTLYHEMNKLICFVGPGQTITAAVVQRLVASRVEENIFEVVDAIGLQDAGRALTGIRNLLLQKHPPQQITGMVARQLRLIVQVGGLMEAGQTREQIIAALKMHSFVYHKISRQCGRFSTHQWADHLHQLLNVDTLVKTGRQQFYPALETFILKICAKKQ